MYTNDRTRCTNDKIGPFQPAAGVAGRGPAAAGRRISGPLVAGYGASTKLAVAGWKPGQIPANFALAEFYPTFWQDFAPTWRVSRPISPAGTGVAHLPCRPPGRQRTTPGPPGSRWAGGQTARRTRCRSAWPRRSPPPRPSPPPSRSRRLRAAAGPGRGATRAAPVHRWSGLPFPGTSLLPPPGAAGASQPAATSRFLAVYKKP